MNWSRLITLLGANASFVVSAVLEYRGESILSAIYLCAGLLWLIINELEKRNEH